MGLLMIFDTTSAEMLDRSLESSVHFAFIKHLVYVGMSLCLGLIVYKIGYERLIALSPIAYGIVLLMLVLALIPGIGQELNGARRWLGIGPFSVQPSEFMKLIFPLLFIRSHAVDYRSRLVLFGLPILLVLLEPDNGCAAIMLASLVALCYLTHVRWIYYVLPLACMLCLGGAIASTRPHVADRLRVYLNPELDLLGKGHQPYQAKIAAGSGGLLGRGVGGSLQKLNYLPEARSDYIAAIFAEEFGFLGICALILLYMAMTYLGFHLSTKATSRSGFVLASSLTFLLALQAFLNLGVVSGLLPSKGTNLPFFSHGGSNFLANATALAMILNVGSRWEERS